MDYLTNIYTNLDELCKECKDLDSDQCKFSKCKIAFVREIIKDERLIIEDGKEMIPNDFRFYDEYTVAEGVANICKMCRNCEEAHDENCVISLSRLTLESTILDYGIEYPGNLLSYLVSLSKKDESFAQKVKEQYDILG